MTQGPGEIEAAAALVARFWDLMRSNDFTSVAAVLAEDFVLEWPQTRERIRGAARYAQMNQEYPAHGPWQFTLNRLIASATEVVTDVSISDGVQSARALSFFTLREGAIAKLVEFWPEPYAAAPGRGHLTEPMD